MKANEYKIVADFIKKNGLEVAKKQIEFAKGRLLGPVGEWRVEYLKQFVESHELVEKLNGLERAKLILKSVPKCLEFYIEKLMFHIERNSYFSFENGVRYAVLGFSYEIFLDGKSSYNHKDDCVYLSQIQQAIADVESCQ